MAHLRGVAGANAETAAFARTYDAALEDDNPEFAYLGQISQDIPMAEGPGESQDPDDDAEPREIGAEDLRRQLREAAQREEASASVPGPRFRRLIHPSQVEDDAFDPHDVTWADADDSDQENDRGFKEAAPLATRKVVRHDDFESVSRVSVPRFSSGAG
jgi:hypothetical protein